MYERSVRQVQFILVSICHQFLVKVVTQYCALDSRLKAHHIIKKHWQCKSSMYLVDLSNPFSKFERLIIGMRIINMLLQNLIKWWQDTNFRNWLRKRLFYRSLKYRFQIHLMFEMQWYLKQMAKSDCWD